MLDAVRAEALKLHRHRATWLMVWIYPVGVALITLGVLIYTALSASGPPEAGSSAARWIADSAIFWSIPKSAPGRFLIAGFAALVFAGEYGWNTWKLIIPARSRWQLIAAKWVVVFGFVLLSLLATDLIGLLGEWLGGFLGSPLPEGITFAALADAHLRAMANALLPIAYTVAFAGLFAVLTQSILATVILSIALVVIEQLMPLLAVFAAQYALSLTALLVEVLPFYHIANFLSWTTGRGLTLPLAPDTIISFSMGSSAAILAGWTVAAGAATQLRFLRQDLN
ncbi:ABC transporter permease [Stakelama tenebrarum]|uniref:ABC transporter permease subunit n=1 Tax=Stakelama tenebrarum TaxID=2711215 RepID=A0A6G6Y8V6_9SPHN|nr:ABC transporter permease [Sphingosinithalassobacter tenebrarum]QIG81148.1 ABC transporter permease subunit [Sphingosinithalassobacter tenebrarum]